MASISMPAFERCPPGALPVPANSQRVAGDRRTIHGPRDSPSSLPMYWTPISDDSGRPSSRHLRIRVSCPLWRVTFQKKLFAERNARLPPRSR